MRAGGRAAVTVAGFVALAAVTSFLVGWFLGDGTFRHSLFSCAGSLEFWGVLLVASPELAPYLRRVGPALDVLWGRTKLVVRRTTNKALQMLGRRPRAQVVSIEAADSAEVSDTVRLSVAVREGTTVEEKVEFLLRRDQETQGRLANLQEKQNDLPERWRSDIDATAGKLRREQREGLDELRDEHLTARVGRVVLLVVGLVLATWGNLVPGS